LRKPAGIQDVWRIPSTESLNPVKNRAVTFTPEELEEDLSKHREWEKQGDEMIRKNFLVSAYYEDLVNDPERTFLRITDLLSVHHVHPRTNLTKQNPERLRDLVIDYDELKSTFSRTEWQTFFEE